MKKLVTAFALVLLIGTPALAQETQFLTEIPTGATTVSHWYKQPVHDFTDTKIGEVNDVLLDENGRAVAFIIGVGGFLGVTDNDIAVPFSSVKRVMKDGKPHLLMTTNKEALKAAPKFRYDKAKGTWMR